MAKSKTEKAAIIDRLEEAFKNPASSVFVHFSKLSVADESAMRRALRAETVKYFVAKKTLIRRALGKIGISHEGLPLEGEVAVAYGGADAAVAPRLVHEWGTKLTDKLAIIGGIFEGKLVGQSEMREIATIPPVDTLRGMFANVLMSPMQRFAIALNEVAKTKGN